MVTISKRLSGKRNFVARPRVKIECRARRPDLVRALATASIGSLKSRPTVFNTPLGERAGDIPRCRNKGQGAR